MRIARIGFTPLKGTRHAGHEAVELSASGPVGDRLFCLVDLERSRVLRTVENPSLVQACARWESSMLTLTLADRKVTGTPRPTGDLRTLDYWGRAASVELVEGPWAGLLGEHLGYEVALARSSRPGQVVYGGSVTLLTSASLKLLSERMGGAVDSRQFRSTFVIDTTGTHHDEPHAEDGWAGHELRLGGATVSVRGRVPRCAVVDIDPVGGARGAGVLRTLAGYRRGGGDIHFGVDATVVLPGRVRVGDTAALGKGMVG